MKGAPETGAGQCGYLEPSVGVDALRDAVAAIRCIAAGDGPGFGAVLNGTDQPRQVAAAMAAIASVVCRRVGLDDAGLSRLLNQVSSEVTDFLLDQPREVNSPGGRV